MLTALCSLLIAWVPGGLLALAVPAGGDRYLAWAAAPALTLGLTAAAMAWLPELGMPHGAIAVLVAEFGLAVAAAGLARWLMRRARSGDLAEVRQARVRSGGPRMWAEFAAVAGSGAVSVGLGYVLLRGLRYPPGWDAMNHANLVANILASGSTQISSACITGSTVSAVSCQFYPLAADVSWAQTALVSGRPVSAAMLAWTTWVGPLAVVAAVYAAVRLLQSSIVVAAAAAVSPALIGPMWYSLERGRPTETFACAFSVAAAMLTCRAARGPDHVRMGALAGVAVAGLLMTHTYDVLFSATLCLAFVVIKRGRWRPRRSLAGGAVLAATAALTIGPLLGALASAGTARTPATPAFSGNFGQAAIYWLAGGQRYTLLGSSHHGGVFGYPLPVKIALIATLVCLAASPLCLILTRLRWAMPWLITTAVWTAIGFWTSTSRDSIAHHLAAFWYAIDARLTTMIAPVYGVLTVAGACAIGLGARALARTSPLLRGRSISLEPLRAAASAALTAVVVLLILALVPSSSARLRADLARYSPSGPAYRRTYEWLAAHTSRGQVVAWDLNRDFLTWAHSDNGVGELFGITGLDAGAQNNFRQRLRVLAWLVNDKGAGAAGCLVKRFNVVYLAVGDKHVPGFRGHYTRSRLAASTRVTLAHVDGPVAIYRVTRAAGSCPTTSSAH